MIRVVKLEETLDFFEAMDIHVQGMTKDELLAQVAAGKAAGNGDHTNVFLSTGNATDATIELTHNWDGEDADKMDPQNDRKYDPLSAPCRGHRCPRGSPAPARLTRAAVRSSTAGRFGHIAIGVDDIYGVCQALSDMGYAILRPPRDGHMAFVKVSLVCATRADAPAAILTRRLLCGQTPDGASIELLQQGGSLPEQEPWKSMASVTNPDGSFTW
jgi:catechol 2,3-dioxygenase-like lactoylglutathione lyase family enzyme